MKKKTLVFVAGIRPDIIKPALILRHLRKQKKINFIFVWSGQHYQDNLKDIFFRELKVGKPDIDLLCSGDTDAEIASQLIAKLSKTLTKIKPDAIAFFGDTNTTAGCIAAAQLNIPIIHIEGCWHSYDWRMPEEKYRTMIDHLSDVIYTYAHEYKERGIAEGLNPKNIIVTGNPIVDILNEFYFKRKNILERKASTKFFTKRNIENGNYYLMTCHRRENVHIDSSFDIILKLVREAKLPVYFPASYRTQKIIKKRKIKLPKNLLMVDPIGYEEMLILATHAKAVITDSGMLSEETCVLNIPSINIRKATERPEIYDVKGTVKFDPSLPRMYPTKLVLKKLNKIIGTTWKQPFGNGKSSKFIADDIVKKVFQGKLRGHLPKDNHLPIKRSFMDDKIKV